MHLKQGEIINNLLIGRNSNAKRLSLRVDPKAGVIRLTIPPRATQFDINRFVNSHRDWIEEKQKTLLPKVQVTDGAIVPFCGVEHIIRIERHQKRVTIIMSLRGGEANEAIQNGECSSGLSRSLSLPRNDNILLIKTSRDDPTTNLKRWMIEQARTVIEPLSHHKAAQIRKKIKKIDLRDTASRWGSCSSDKRLMFSWRLIMAPEYVLDYVIAHEVAHLKRMDHSQKFWDICYDLSERPDEARRWLKSEGNSLMRYF